MPIEKLTQIEAKNRLDAANNGKIVPTIDMPVMWNAKLNRYTFASKDAKEREIRRLNSIAFPIKLTKDIASKRFSQISTGMLQADVFDMLGEGTMQGKATTKRGLEASWRWRGSDWSIDITMHNGRVGSVSQTGLD